MQDRYFCRARRRAFKKKSNGVLHPIKKPPSATSNIITPAFEEASLQPEEPSMSKANTDAKSMQGITAGADPLISIAREMKRLNDRYLQLDDGNANQSKTNTARIYCKAEMFDLWEKLTTMRDYCTTLQASSLEGAIIQLSVAHWVISEITEDGQEVTPAVKSKIERLMFSRHAALKACVASHLDDLYLFQDINDALNPWINYETRIARFDKVSTAQ